jgi:hypothetical protein
MTIQVVVVSPVASGTAVTFNKAFYMNIKNIIDTQQQAIIFLTYLQQTHVALNLNVKVHHLSNMNKILLL